MKLLILGDSLTEGYGIDKEDAFPALVAKKLQNAGIKVEVINAGISGSTTASGVKRLNWHLKAKPTHLLLALGANDGLRGVKIEETRSNLEQIIDLAQKNQITTFLAGMKLPPNYGTPYTKDFENMFIQLAENKKIPLLPFLLEGVAGEKDLNQLDGIHPNKKGHEIISQKVFEFLKVNLPSASP